jgi:hypothetical protein
MKKENLYNEISKAVESLLNLARDISFNSISDNCLFIISEIKHHNKNSFEQNKIRKAANDKKTPKSLNEIIIELEELYPNLYDINLYIYKAEKNSTIIEICYFARSSLKVDYQKISETRETMLHLKIDIPPYLTEKSNKFDINWQLRPFYTNWKLFWWKIRTIQLVRK